MFANGHSVFALIICVFLAASFIIIFIDFKV